MKKLEVTVKDNIRSVVYMLLAAKERGERVYAEYNGKFFYSDTVKISDIYINGIGNDRNEYLASAFEGLPTCANDSKSVTSGNNLVLGTDIDNEEQKKLLEENVLKRVPEWISEGKDLICNGKLSLWQEIVLKRSIDLYRGKDLDVFLGIMRSIRDGGSMEDIVSSYINSEYSDVFRAFVNFLIKEFSDKSEEFFNLYDAQMVNKNVDWKEYNPSLRPHKKRVKSK